MIAAQQKPGWLRSLQVTLLVCFLAFFTGILSVEIVARGTKIMIAGIGGLTGLAMILLAWPLGQARNLVLFGIAFALSVDFSKSFALHVFTEGQYVQNVGGAAGLTISAVFLGAVVLLVLRWVEGRAIQAPWPYILPWAAFACVGMVTLPTAVDPSLVVWELIRIAMLLVILLAMANIDPDELRRFLIFTAVAVGCQGAIATAQYVTGGTLGLSFLGEQDLQVESIGFEAVSRATGTIGNPNILAYYFELLLPPLLALGLARKDAVGFPAAVVRLILLGALLAGLAGLGLTLSRAGWLTMGLILPCVFVVIAGRALLTRPGILLLVVLLLIVVAVCTYIAPAVLERMFGDDGGSLAQRGPLNRGAWELISGAPLFGIGLNNFGPAFAILDTTGAARVFTNVNHVVHNMYLLVAAETGFVGLAAFITIFALALRRALRLYRTAGSPMISSLGLGIAAGIVAQLVHGLIDPGFRLSLSISQLIFVLLGLLAACETFSKEESK